MAKRAGITVAPMFQQTAPGEWKLTGLEELKRKPDPLEDRYLWDDDYIVIVRMVADEQDHRNPPTNASKEDFPVWLH